MVIMIMTLFVCCNNNSDASGSYDRYASQLLVFACCMPSLVTAS